MLEMQSQTINLLIENMAAILMAAGALVAAVSGIFAYRRTGEAIVQSKSNETILNAVQKQNKTQESKIDEVQSVVNHTSEANRKELSKVTRALGVSEQKVVELTEEPCPPDEEKANGGS